MFWHCLEDFQNGQSSLDRTVFERFWIWNGFLHNTSTNVFTFRTALKQFILYCASTVTETKQELVLGTEDKQIYFQF